ncbi:zf-C3HC-domain-containing protein [Mollisia scopiformis]|uniref:Zf-C3HC-domain-containing protein n=1 Tax=Mollisia scopiformis TaxID=149040 RepID=A0A194XS11_MOLSC|nr:zf-C3HC-domain-containing protein [Mollisia scopiformis]KUJ23085.1 zf-C3HC-domain-containing protein [Mollisia scopiformis]
MNATKRKFNALINGIGNKSTTTLASKEVNNVPDNNGDSQTKKRRVSDRSSITSSIDMPSATRKPLATMKHKKAALSTTAAATEPPKYAPWDREAFLKRLKSFSNLTDWTPKPARVNEVEWAKRGWVCQKLERVRCCLCNVEILVKLNRKEVEGKEQPVYIAEKIGALKSSSLEEDADSCVEEALVDKYVELIVSSHDEGCLWRKRGCDDSIFKLPLNHTGTTFRNLRERYDEICKRSENLPYKFNMRTPQGFDLDVVLANLPPNFFSSPTDATPDASLPPADVNKVALLMALFGWQGHTHDRLGAQMGSVSCHACFRVLGLWIFKSKEVNAAGEEVVGPTMSCLDVVKEHREYCPWQNAISQNGKGPVKTSTTGMAGWGIILRILHNDHLLRSRRESPLGKIRHSVTENAIETDSALGTDVGDEDAMSIRDEEDKQRWARLRRVKSLFETKGGKKLTREKSKSRS